MILTPAKGTSNVAPITQNLKKFGDHKFTESEIIEKKCRTGLLFNPKHGYDANSWFWAGFWNSITHLGHSAYWSCTSEIFDFCMILAWNFPFAKINFKVKNLQWNSVKPCLKCFLASVAAIWAYAPAETIWHDFNSCERHMLTIRLFSRKSVKNDWL